MRSLATLALCALALVVASCSDAPTTTSDTRLGKMTLDEFRANQAYNVWFSAGYDAYPDPNNVAVKARFDTAIAHLKAGLDPAKHEVLAVIKPTCSCQLTQLYLPRVIRALDAAGFPHEKISIYVTDNRMAGIDDVKGRFGLSDAPAFIVLKNNVEKGRIYQGPSDGKTVEEDLATFFTVQ